MIKFFKLDEKKRMTRLPEFEEGCWVDLVNPTDDEVEDAIAATGVPEEMLKAALDEEETARFERDEDCTLFLVDTPTIRDTDDGDTYETIPIALIISNRTPVDTRKPVLFILTFMMGNAKKFLSNLRQIDKKSLRVQAELHRSMKNKELIQLLDLENSLVYYSTSLSANIGVFNKMERLPVISQNEEYKDLFDDVAIEMRQAVEMCNIYRDILSGTMDAFASVISNNVNIVMKLLTVITIIITIPTLIASWWGMNVDVPFENSSAGFWIVIALSVVATAVSSYFLIRMTNSIRIKTPKLKKKKRRGE